MNYSSDGQHISFDPAQLEVGIYPIAVVVSDDGLPNLSARDFVYLSIRESLPVLGNADRNGNLISDRDDGWDDSNRNGIPNYLDPFTICDVIPERLFEAGLYTSEVEPSICIRKGSTAMELLEAGIQVFQTGTDAVTTSRVSQQSQLLANGSAPNDPEVVNVGGLFDWLLTELSQSGQTIRYVIPQRQPIPPQPRYRQYDSQLGWVDFTETASDRLWSTAGEPGFCPPPGSELWSPGMTQGHYCLQVQITDGGSNDLDGEANRVIFNLGGVGVTIQNNNAPLALNDVLSMRWNSQVDIDVLANDSDPDNDPLEVISVTPALGTAEILANNRIRFTPPENYGGTITIAYSITDGQGGIASAVIFVDVLANTAPVAVDDVASTDDRSAITIQVLSNDYDLDGDALTITSVTAQQGTVSIVNGQTLRYTPRVGFAGTDVLNYQISDGRGGSASATVRVQIKVVETVVITNVSSKGSFSAWMLMLVVLLTLFTTAARASTSAQSAEETPILQAEEEHDWRFSVQLGQAKVRGSDADLIRRLPTGATLLSSQWRDTSYAVEIDYLLSNRWSLSVGYSNLGKGIAVIQADTVDPAATHQAAAGIQPMLVKGYSVGLNLDVIRAEDYDVTVGAGLFDWTAQMESRMGSAVIRKEDKGSDWFWRLSAEYKLNENWRIGGTYRYFMLDDKINDFALKLSYQF